MYRALLQMYLAPFVDSLKTIFHTTTTDLQGPTTVMIGIELFYGCVGLFL